MQWLAGEYSGSSGRAFSAVFAGVFHGEDVWTDALTALLCASSSDGDDRSHVLHGKSEKYDCVCYLFIRVSDGLDEFG